MRKCPCGTPLCDGRHGEPLAENFRSSQDHRDYGTPFNPAGPSAAESEQPTRIGVINTVVALTTERDRLRADLEAARKALDSVKKLLDGPRRRCTTRAIRNALALGDKK